MTALSVDNLDFRRSVKLLLDLQNAICEDDEDTADQLRDDLERPLRRLIWPDKEWLRGLSGDLEMLCSREVFEPNPYSPDDYKKRVLAALSAREAETLLTLLRMEQRSFPEEMLAYGRSRAYSWFGLFEVSLAFLHHAMRISSTGHEYLVFQLHDLAQSGRYQEMWETAQTLFANPQSPEAVYIAVGEVTARIVSVKEAFAAHDQRAILGALRQETQRTLNTTPLGRLGSENAVLGNIMLGFVQEALGRKAKAKASYLTAANLMPESDAPWLFLGNLLFSTDIEQSIHCFSKAVELKTTHPVAYLIVAMVSLNAGEYEKCVELCGKAREFSGLLEDAEYRARVDDAIHSVLSQAKKAFNLSHDSFPTGPEKPARPQQVPFAQLFAGLDSSNSLMAHFLSERLERPTELGQPLRLAA